MNSIGNLLMQYKMDRFGQGIMTGNHAILKAKNVTYQKIQNNEGVKAELGEDKQKGLSEVKPQHTNVHSLSRLPKTHHGTKTEATDTEVQKKLSQNLQTADASPSVEQLELKEIQEITLGALKVAWGSKEGEENYNASYDFDGNGEINILDWPHFLNELQNSFQEFKQAYGSKTGENNFDVRCDYNNDKKINILDWPNFIKRWTA